jgi:hypothetical protein
MRFTIRDLLWLMVVVAMGMAWLNERRISLIREADVTEREASITHREESLKSDIRWLRHPAPEAEETGRVSDMFLPTPYHAPNPNDL